MNAQAVLRPVARRRLTVATVVPCMASTPPERIRILFVTPNLGVGGAERHIATLAPALDLSRFDRDGVHLRAGSDVRRRRAAACAELSLDSRMRRAPSALVALVRAMRRFRPHVVITRGFNAETLGRTAAAVARVPASVVWKHNCGDLKRRMRARVADRILDPVTDFYFGVAFGQVPYLVNDLGLPGDKIRIIRNGVDPDAHTRIEDEARLAAIRASTGHRPVGPRGRDPGRAADREGSCDVPARRPRRGRPHAAGAPAHRRRRAPAAGILEALADELGLGERAVFAGMRSDAGEILSVVDVVVLSSFTIECFPFAVLEAMSASVPAVCTAIGGLPELVEDGVTGFLVPPRDPRGSRRGSSGCSEPPGRAREMGAAARRRLEERFTLERSVAETERVLEEAVGPLAATAA